MPDEETVGEDGADSDYWSRSTEVLVEGTNSWQLKDSLQFPLDATLMKSLNYENTILTIGKNSKILIF